MGVIINLKEIFAADGQEIFTDKINFNFNKLLELGIGDQGPIGLTGPAGAAGPVGTQGDDGERGNKWFVGVGDPNGQVFPDLLEGDFYLETTDSSIWQYQGSPASWIQVTDLSEVVINIIEAEGSPFVRGFGEASPLDDRFITFTKRGNDNADIIADTSLGNSANNDTLLLTNWNERVTTIDNFPALTDEEFNAIQSISVNHTLNPLGRYHLEFSSLNDVTGQTELSNLNHNLKVRYLKDQVVSTSYPVSNQFINIGRFSMSIPETVAPIDIDEQGIFEFITPKYQDTTEGSPIKENMTLKIGSSEPLSETSLMDIAVDGIDLSVDSKAINFGLIRDLETFTSVQTLPLGLSGDFGMINVSSLVNGLMVKGNTYHTKSLSTIHVDSKYQANDNLSTITGTTSSAQGYQGIFSDGKYLFAASPNEDGQESRNDNGSFQAWDISDPDNPLELFQLSINSSWNGLVGVGPSYDLHGNPAQDGPFPGYNTPTDGVFNRSPLTGIRDVAFAGKYGAYIRRAPGVGSPVNNFSFDSFFMFEMDSNISNSGASSGFKVISWLGYDTTFSDFMTGSSYQSNPVPELDTARRVKISGNWAFVMSSGENMAWTDPSYFSAIDITNPTRPFIGTDYIRTTSDSRHIDFDIHGETAYVLSQIKSGTYRLSVLKVNLFNPETLRTNIGIETEIVPYPSLIPGLAKGSIKVVGSRVYITDPIAGAFYIYEDSVEPDRTMTLISSTALPTNHDPYDIEVSGNFAYVYTDRGNSRSKILIYDISDDSSPLLLEPYEDFQSTTGNGRPSKMTMVGDRIYTIAASNGTEAAGVNSVKIDGINSPAAKIGNIHSKDIKVANNLSVSQNLQVGRSAAIGSGGLWVDKGSGINTDSSIKINISSLEEFVGYASQQVNKGGLLIESNGVYDTGALTYPALTGTTVRFNDITLPGLSGFVIASNNIIKDTESTIAIGLSIDLDGITSTSDVTGISISGADRNYFEGRFDTPGVQTNSGIQITSVEDEDTISSGSFDVTGGNFTQGRLHWIRTGNIVHAKGWVRVDPAGGGSTVGSIPHTLGEVPDPAFPAIGIATTVTGAHEYIEFHNGTSTGGSLDFGTQAAASYWYLDFTYKVI